MGNGRQWWSWIDMTIWSARFSTSSRPNLARAGERGRADPVRNAEFTKTLASVLSRPAIFPMPAFAARLVFGQMGEELLLASQRVEPAKLMASGYVFQKPDLRIALEDLEEVRTGPRIYANQHGCFG